MATIPRAALDYLTREINGISADAQRRVLRVLESIAWTPETIAECRDIVILALAEVMPTYTDMAAQASADFYDASRELCVGQAMGATAISGYDPAKTDGAVRAFVQGIVDGKPVEQFNDQVLQRIDYEMKRSAGNSIVQNGMRDPAKPRFARVPTGAETCDFCLMLASRGFVYHSEKSAGGLDHWHTNCDCRVVASWDADAVEGYDPDALYRRWVEGRDAPSAVRYLEDARDAGEITYSKPLEAFVGTDDERDLSAHVALHRSGYRFEVAAEDAPEGFSNIDLVMGGEPWEVKSPDADGRSRDPLRFVEKNLRKAKRQFLGSETPDAPVRVVLNGIYAAPADGEVRERIVSEMRRHGIESVIHIRKDGSTERI